jgi:hypothetical protein
MTQSRVPRTIAALRLDAVLPVQGPPPSDRSATDAADLLQRALTTERPTWVG